MVTHPPDSASGPEADVLDTGRAGRLVMAGALYRLIGFGAGALLAAASAILLTRHLGRAGFGEYATIVALATLVSQLTEGGLTTLATRDFALASPAVKAKLIGTRLGLQLVTTVLAIIICGGFALSAGYGATRVWATLAAALGLSLAMLQTTVAIPLTTALRFAATSLLELLRQALLVAVTVVLVLVGAGLLPLLAAIVPSSIIALGGTWALARRLVPLRPSFDPGAWVALLRPALVLSLSSGVATIYIFTTQIITSLVASPGQTGLFAASLRVFAVIGSVPALMVSSALPLLSRAARDDTGRLEFALQGLFEIALIAGVGVGVVLVVGAGPIIAVVGGSNFRGSAAPLRIEGAAVLGTCLTPVWSTGLLALHRHTAQLVCNAIGLLVVVGFTLWLAPKIGARGSALATAVAEWAVATAYLVALARTEGRLVPRAARSVTRVALAAALAFAAMLLPIAALPQLLVAATVYVVMILITGVVPREVLELLPGRFARLPHSGPRHPS